MTMLENEFYISELIAGHFRNQLNANQQQALMLWRQKSPKNEAYFLQLQEESLLKSKLKSFDKFGEHQQEVWNKALNTLGPSFKTYTVRDNKPVNIKKVIYALSAAAAIIFILGAGIYFFKLQSLNDSGLVHDVPAGKLNATLTLSSGKKIALSDLSNGQVALESGVSITKTSNGKLVYKIIETGAGKMEYNTLSTKNGEQYQLLLPDGSSVFLNAASSIRFPTRFSGLKSRDVTFEGEGYFEVAKNKAVPFVVRSYNQVITVLGTRFNLNSYKGDQSVKTVLLEGSVAVRELFGQKALLNLEPGEQSLLTTGGLALSKADVEEAMAWKNGFFRFNDEPLIEIMNKISRWYDVEIEYEGGAERYKSITLGGFVSRSKNISTVLKIIEQTDRVHCKLQGKRVLIYL